MEIKKLPANRKQYDSNSETAPTTTSKFLSSSIKKLLQSILCFENHLHCLYEYAGRYYKRRPDIPAFGKLDDMLALHILIMIFLKMVVIDIQTNNWLGYAVPVILLGIDQTLKEQV